MIYNNTNAKLRILLSPLDWGLGHATRCIPIIKALISLDCVVIIASDKSIFELLKKEFPTLEFVRMSGYEIKYSRKIGGFYLKMLSQLPSIITAIRKENTDLKNIIEKYAIDAVISDNRFGLYSTNVPSIYITHQLNIKTGFYLTDKIVTAIHRSFIKKFSVTWIPDFEKDGLAGELSHPKKLPDNSLYLGALSRFTSHQSVNKKYNLLISLSGPEPQRTILENIILEQSQHRKETILLVRGLPDSSENLTPTSDRLKIVNHLTARELNIAFEEADIVIARSGYTTIMDLAKLNKKAILIPTPGQAEQVYLANYLMEKNYFYSVNQTDFLLNDALEKVAEFHFKPLPFREEIFFQIISKFVASLKSGNFVH